MSSSSPHLLNLPRELRNRIYDYLYQDFKFHLTCKISRKKLVSFDAQLQNGPLRSVLLICTQINDEYRKSKCFKNFSVVVTWSQFPNSSHRADVLERDRRNRRFDNAFLLLRNATILVFCQAHINSDWQAIALFCDGLKRKAPNLWSIRLAFHHHLLVVSESDMVASTGPQALINDAALLPVPPSIIAGLPLRQVGEGIQSEYAWGLVHPDVSHRLKQLGVYLYADYLAPRYWWWVDEVLGKWPAVKYGEHILGSMPVERAEACKKATLEMWDWYEKRGEQVKTWRGLFDGERKAISLADDDDDYSCWFHENLDSEY